MMKTAFSLSAVALVASLLQPTVARAQSYPDPNAGSGPAVASPPPAAATATLQLGLSTDSGAMPGLASPWLAALTRAYHRAWNREVPQRPASSRRRLASAARR